MIGAFLTGRERENTILHTTCDSCDKKVFRLHRLSTISDLEGLFTQCARRWDIEPDRISRLFTRIPENEGLVEIVRGNDNDFEELIRIIKRAWRKKETVVHIPIFLQKRDAD
jgi:hypothetical protein